MEMADDLFAIPSPPILVDSRSVKPEDGSRHVVPVRDAKAVHQRYIVNEIKKLIGGCEDFIGLVAVEKGSPEILVSPNLKQHRYTILGDAYGNFAQYLSGRSLMTGMWSSDTLPSLLTHTGNHIASARQAPKPQKQMAEPDTRLPSGSISYTFQRPPKRHRSRTINPRNPARPRTHQNGQGARLVCETPASQIRVDDREKLEQWFEQAFLTLQQVACRLVAKIWIKKIHPKKQSTHPYNGGMPRGEPADSNRTKPPYWPKHVIHREPDHIGREDRTSLLVHLIMETPQPIITNPADLQNQQTVNAGDLLECLEVKRDELREDRWEILEQITRARQMMEQYEAGEIDGDAVVFLNDYSDGFRLTSNDSETEVPGPDDPRQAVSSDGSHDEESAAGADMTPASSTQNSPAGQLHADGALQASRHRTSMVGENAKGRRIAGRRARLAGNTGRVPSGMPPPHAQELQHDMTMGPLKSEYMSGPMLHDPRGQVNQRHGGPGMMVGIPPELSSTAFDGVLDHHADSRDMTSCLPPQGLRPQGMGSQPWLGMMPNMGTESLEQIFGVAPHVVTNPDLAHSFFGPVQHDMSGGMQNGLPLMSPMPYHDYGESNQHNLPFRGVEGPPSGMASQPDMKMDLMPNSFY